MLITLEYTGKGTLDRLIRDMSPPNGGVGGLRGLGQVVHLLRGVASGMQFFADLGYVHKVRKKKKNKNKLKNNQA